MRTLLLLVVALLAGCATVTGGSRDPDITITSSPSGATLSVAQEPCGATPAIVQLSRKSEHRITLTHPGYEPAVVTVKRNLNPWVFGNLVVGGLLGVVVDVCTDSTYKLSPNEVHVNLKPLTATPP